MTVFQKSGFLLLLFSFLACKNKTTADFSEKPIESTALEISYATGFSVESYNDYKVLTVQAPWPGSEKVFRYLLVSNKKNSPPVSDFDAVVQVPVKRIIPTSTTHIPSLENLGEVSSLAGFPDPDLISSSEIRSYIEKGNVPDVGKNESLNTEIIVDLDPDVLIGFGMDASNSSYKTLERSGIPVLYNSDWTETSPLGKAEWIKFFGVLFNKEKEADSIFKTVETAYLEAKKLASTSDEKPLVMSGAMYRDIWYLPGGNSWAAGFINDANGSYLWENTGETGSLSLNLENVLEKGIDADVWIGPAQYTSLNELKNAGKVYTQFKAFKTGAIYSYSMKKGKTGGIIYFEQAPNRPDLVLKDHIKMLHPDLLPDYELYFFEKLQ